MHPDLTYDGQRLHWNGHGTFAATSGLPDFQLPKFQCFPDAGPVPEGFYTLSLKEDPKPARDDGTDSCRLIPAQRVQTIPRRESAGVCEPFWANWGTWRVRLEPADAATRRKCSPRRAGFYLHDSKKGYSHGCIEVEPRFFAALRGHIAAIKARRVPTADHLTLKVHYVPGRATNGGTKAP